MIKLSAIEKELKLISIFKEMKNVVIAFSGGVDSTYLTAIAHKVLGNNVLAVTIKTEFMSAQEINEAINLANHLKINHKIINTSSITNEQIVKNTDQRCFFCKTDMFNYLIKIANESNFNTIIDGSNIDDMKDFRPGLRALKNLKVRSPLIEAELSKEEIRSLSKRLNLPTWNKPSFSCLATRIPYDNDITLEKLQQLEKAEDFIKDLEINQFRVRHHGNIARIEVTPNDFPKVILNHVRIVSFLNHLGFIYVTLDLQGYRTGSLNEELKRTD